jgi:hypothetical protein
MVPQGFIFASHGFTFLGVKDSIAARARDTLTSWRQPCPAQRLTIEATSPAIRGRSAQRLGTCEGGQGVSCSCRERHRPEGRLRVDIGDERRFRE